MRDGAKERGDNEDSGIRSWMRVSQRKENRFERERERERVGEDVYRERVGYMQRERLERVRE